MANARLHDLQRLVNNLLRPGHHQYQTHLRHFHAYIQKTPLLNGIVEVLVARTSDFDLTAWAEAEITQHNRGNASWPDRDDHKVRACWFLIETSLTPEQNYPGSVARLFTLQRGDLDDEVRLFTHLVVQPLVEYVEARIEASSHVLYLLERYRRRVEWFDGDALHERYLADTKRGEKLYDQDLRRFLFDQGIDHPFSQARSASGEADVIADLHTEDPLVCEVKLYDGDSYAVPYIAKGLRQAVRYAHDYGTAVGHLVVFNLSDERLELPTDEPQAGRPPRVVVEGVTVFVCVVQARPLPSASSDRKARVRRVAREDLVRMAEDD